MTSTYLERLLDPWREFERMNRLIGWPAGSTAEYPAINIWVAGDDAIVTTEIAGIDRNGPFPVFQAVRIKNIIATHIVMSV